MDRKELTSPPKRSGSTGHLPYYLKEEDGKKNFTDSLILYILKKVNFFH